MPQPPTPKQLACLRRHASRTGQTFAMPKTIAEASAQIQRLKSTAGQTRVERYLEGQGSPDRPATTIWDDEVTGWGSSARWS